MTVNTSSSAMSVGTVIPVSRVAAVPAVICVPVQVSNPPPPPPVPAFASIASAIACRLAPTVVDSLAGVVTSRSASVMLAPPGLAAKVSAMTCLLAPTVVDSFAGVVVSRSVSVTVAAASAVACAAVAAV